VNTLTSLSFFRSSASNRWLRIFMPTSSTRLASALRRTYAGSTFLRFGRGVVLTKYSFLQDPGSVQSMYWSFVAENVRRQMSFHIAVFRVNRSHLRSSDTHMRCGPVCAEMIRVAQAWTAIPRRMTHWRCLF
jgi:hypothetical protein